MVYLRLPDPPTKNLKALAFDVLPSPSSSFRTWAQSKPSTLG